MLKFYRILLSVEDFLLLIKLEWKSVKLFFVKNKKFGLNFVYWLSD